MVPYQSLNQNKCYLAVSFPNLKLITSTQSKNSVSRKKGRYADVPFVDKTYSLHLATVFAVFVVSLCRTKHL